MKLEVNVTTPVIQVRDLCARYSRNGSAGTNVLQNVSFCVSEGQTLVVLGPNGSGKSTLLYAITGELDGHVKGDIRVRERSVLSEPRHRRARSIAIVYQDPSRGTAAHLTLREHCELTAAMPGRRRVTWADVASRLDLLGTMLNPRQLAGELSGGQRQLFTLLLTVLSAPGILLLDEPTSALDARHAALVLDVVREFSGPRTATIMVTHDLAEARQVGHSLLVLTARGEVQAFLDEEAKTSLNEAALRTLLAEASASTWTRGVLKDLLEEGLSR